MELSIQQETFCREYTLSQNATQAAIRAGYSKSTAGQQGSRLLKSVKVKTRIAELLKNETEKAEIGLERIMQELAVVAFGTMSEIATWAENSVTMKASTELSDEQLRCIESVAQTGGKDGKAQLRIKLHSKLRALGGLLRVFGLSEIEARLSKLEEKLGEGK